MEDNDFEWESYDDMVARLKREEREKKKEKQRKENDEIRKVVERE